VVATVQAANAAALSSRGREPTEGFTALAPEPRSGDIRDTAIRLRCRPFRASRFPVHRIPGAYAARLNTAAASLLEALGRVPLASWPVLDCAVRPELATESTIGRFGSRSRFETT